MLGLFLIVVPVLELALLVKTGQVIGVWPTLALVVTAAFTGHSIISRQSFTVLRQTLEAMSEGRPPVAQVLDGLFLMLAGALFLTPGLDHGRAGAAPADTAGAAGRRALEHGHASAHGPWG